MTTLTHGHIVRRRRLTMKPITKAKERRLPARAAFFVLIEVEETSASPFIYFQVGIIRITQ